MNCLLSNRAFFVGFRRSNVFSALILVISICANHLLFAQPLDTATGRKLARLDSHFDRKKNLTGNNAVILNSYSLRKANPLIARSYPRLFVAQIPTKPSNTNNLNPGVRSNISISGTLENQTYASNFQNPYLRNSPVYSRFYFRPTATIYGIPISINSFYTTETEGQYRNRFIQVSFNKSVFDANARDKITENLNAKLREHNYRRIDLNLLTNAEAQLKNDMNRVVNRYNYQQSLTKILEYQIEAEKKNVEILTRKHSGSFDSSIKHRRNEISGKGYSILDSLKHEMRNRTEMMADSLIKRSEDNEMISNSQNRIDSLNDVLEKYQLKEKVYRSQLDSIQREYDTIMGRYARIKNLLELDSVGIKKYKELLQKPSLDGLLKKSPLKLGEMEITKFEIGQVSPVYSFLGINGIPVRGTEVMVKNQNWFGGITVGRTTNSGNFYSSTNQKPVFNKPTQAFIVGKNINHNRVFIHLLHIGEKDRKVSNNETNERNIVLSTGAELEFKKVLRINFELATSSYRLNPTGTTVLYKGEKTVESFDFTKKLTNSSAQKVNLTYEISGNTVLNLNYERFNPSFKNLGNPFIRHNFMVREVKISQSLMANKIRMEAFYKEGKDNLSNEREFTNKNKGFGFKGRTAFKKYPNLMVFYSPIQFGNNHPDSALRTNNQMNFTMVAVSWNKNCRKVRTSTFINYSHSKQHFSNITDVQLKTYSLNENISLSKQVQINIQASYSRTIPAVDSMNCISQSVGIFHSPNSKSTWNLSIDNVNYFNGGYRRGGFIGGSIILKNNSKINTQLGMSKLHNFWGLQDAIQLFAQIGVLWNW
jgi:hypothetical protein